MADIAILEVLLHGEPIGTLTRLPGDQNLFAFNQEYIGNPSRPTLSLSFKDSIGELITAVKPTRTRLAPFFSNLLPEGPMRGYLANRALVDPGREFFLIWALGSDLPGALKVHPADENTSPIGALSDVSNEERNADEEAILRFSLAGVQLKFSAVMENTGGLTIPANGMGGSWIVKLPSTKFNGVPENEFVMMELARRVGIDVPETTLIPLNQIRGLPKEMDSLSGDGLAIKRFDRADEGTPIHIEDFAQIFGVYPEKKYTRASYRNIAEVIWAEIGEVGIAEFIRRFVFNALIGNGDMHLKNWSLIYPDRRNPALAPAYDFVSTIPYMKEEKLALTFVDSKEFESMGLDQFDRFAGKAGLPRKLVLDTAQETVELFAEAWDAANDLPIKEEIRIAINTHLERIPLWKNQGHFG